MEVDRPWVGADGMISVDLCCAGCGYNLRGLNDSGLCPECGALIRESVGRFGGAAEVGRSGRLVAWVPAGLSVAMVGVLVVVVQMPRGYAWPIMVTGMVVQFAAVLITVASTWGVGSSEGVPPGYRPVAVAATALGVSCLLFAYRLS